MRKLCVFLLGLLSAQAQTFTTVASLDGANGANPGNESLVEDADGLLYGTARIGGDQLGTIFAINPQGHLGLVRSFAFGANPDGSLTVTGDQTLYGTTVYGGASNCGTVFTSTPDGVVSTLHSFTCSDGQLPAAGVIQGFNQMLYGVTNAGGATGGAGTLFRMTTSGTLTTLHNFKGFLVAPPDGALPLGEL